MKKIILIMLIVGTLTGCNKKVEQNNNEKPEEEIEENIEEPKKDEYVDNNPIELGLYMYYGKNTNRKKLTEYQTSFVEGKDWLSLEVYYTKEDSISADNQKLIWNQYYTNYNNIDSYRIGYKISFTTINNEQITKYILSPKDTNDIFNYVQIYLYDDIHVQDGVWYSHVTEEEYNNDTILTSIKLTGSYNSNDITSDILLEAFTYDADDFDENHNYRGNSKTSITIKKI